MFQGLHPTVRPHQRVKASAASLPSIQSVMTGKWLESGSDPRKRALDFGHSVVGEQVLPHEDTACGGRAAFPAGINSPSKQRQL